MGHSFRDYWSMDWSIFGDCGAHESAGSILRSSVPQEEVDAADEALVQERRGHGPAAMPEAIAPDGGEAHDARRARERDASRLLRRLRIVVAVHEGLQEGVRRNVGEAAYARNRHEVAHLSRRAPRGAVHGPPGAEQGAASGTGSSTSFIGAPDSATWIALIFAIVRSSLSP